MAWTFTHEMRLQSLSDFAQGLRSDLAAGAILDSTWKGRLLADGRSPELREATDAFWAAADAISAAAKKDLADAEGGEA